MTPTRHVLALDAGGSKCEALLADDQGRALRIARAQIPGLSGRSAEVVLRAAREVIRDHPYHVIHLASLSNRLEVTDLGLPDTVDFVYHDIHEGDGPFALTGARSGVVVVAGTGARAFGRNTAGRELTLDGLGPILGDIGGGYQIGTAALRATGRAVWHPRHQTRLRDRVFDVCEQYMTQLMPAPSPRRPLQVKGITARSVVRRAINADLDPSVKRLGRLIKFSLTPQDRSVIASLARIVDEEARHGDAIALRILRDAAAGLAETIRDLVDHLQLAEETFPLIGIGSVAMKSDLYWNELCRHVHTFAVHAQPQRPVLPPVVGLALGVLLELDGINPDRVRERLLATAAALYQSKESTS